MSEDDYGKPLLFKVSVEEGMPYCFFAGRIKNRSAITTETVDDWGNSHERYVMMLRNIPAESHYLRIDEILS